MGNIILQEALDKFLAKETTKNKSEVPWLIWLMENPKSPLHLHGASALNDHDYVHIILDKGQANDDEAFVIGFTMGNDWNTIDKNTPLNEVKRKFNVQ